jgi:RHS repeat-associated protein
MSGIRRSRALARQLIAGLAVVTIVQPAAAAPADVVNMPAPMIGADPPKAEALRDGDASVSTQTGALQYVYPIDVPPGRLGNAPKLSLRYSSQAPLHGDIAAGWTLGLPEISRDTSEGVLRQVAMVANGREGLTFVSSLAGGRPLVPVTEPTSPGVYQTYRAQNDTSFMRYEWMDDDQPFRWRVYALDGTTYYFGDDALIATGGVDDHDRAPLTRTVDAFGNTVEYAWRREGLSEYEIDEIRYTSNPAAGLPAFAKVEFTWEWGTYCGGQQVGAATSFRAGSRQRAGNGRLTRIVATAFDPATSQTLHTRQLTLGYDLAAESCAGGAAPTRLLESIQESAWGATTPRVDLPAVRFTYGSATRDAWSWDTWPQWPASSVQPISLTSGDRFAEGTAWPTVESMFLDIDGDGLVDRLRSSHDGSQCLALWDRNTGSRFVPAGTIPLPNLPADGTNVPFSNQLPDEACALNAQYARYHNYNGSCDGKDDGTYLAYRWLDLTGDGLVDLVTAIHHDPNAYDPNLVAPFNGACGEERPACYFLDNECMDAAVDCMQGLCELDYQDVDACLENGRTVPCDVMMFCELFEGVNGIPNTASLNCEHEEQNQPKGCDRARVPHQKCGRYPWMIYENLGGGQFSNQYTLTYSPVPLESDNGDSPSGGGSFTSSGHAIIDLDGDGHLDAVAKGWMPAEDIGVANGRPYWFVWKGDGTGEFHGDSEGRPYVWLTPMDASPGVSRYEVLDPDVWEYSAISSTTAGLHDFNGDGLVDYYWQREPHGPIEIYWNDGSGFGQSDSFGATVDYVSAAAILGDPDGVVLVPQKHGAIPRLHVASGEKQLKTRLSDFDGDGRTDLIYSHIGGDGHWTTPVIHFGSGLGVLAGTALSTSAILALEQRTYVDHEDATDRGTWHTSMDFLDLDGDGAGEYVLASQDGVHRYHTELDGKPPRQMIGIDNGQGLSIAIDYTHLADPESVATDPAQRRASPQTRWVVKALTTTDAFEASPSTAEYRYEHPVWGPDDRGDWGFRGFEVVRTRGARGAITEELYGYDVDWSGRLTSTRTYRAEDNAAWPAAPTHPTSLQTTEWSERTLFGGAITTYHPTQTWAYTCAAGQALADCRQSPAALRLDETVWAAIESSSANAPRDREALAWVETGKIVQDGGLYDQGDRRTETAYYLEADATTYRLRATGATSHELDGTAEEVFARTETTWDPTWRVALLETVHLGDGEVATTERAYDMTTGNVLWVIKPEQRDMSGQPRTSFTYDNRGLFVRTTTDELGHAVEETRDYGTGVVIERRGPNTNPCPGGAQNCFASDPDFREPWITEIDGLGRLRAAWVPTLVPGLGGYGRIRVSETVYVDTPSGTTPTSITARSLVSYGGTTWSEQRTDLDGHGRPIKITTTGSPGSITTYDYNEAGNLVAVQVPDPANDAALVTYTYEFDSIGRPTSMRRPVGSGVDMSYDGLVHVSTEVAGVQGGSTATTELIHDAFGRLAVVREATGGTPAFAETFYEYDARDQVERIVDADGVETVLVHDWAGRRTRIERGTRAWEYSYDRNGNLEAEVSPHASPAERLAHTTTFGYDHLGRVTSRLVAPRAMSLADRQLFGVGPDAISLQYDTGVNGIGRLTRARMARDASGIHVLDTSYTYDAEGNVTEERRSFRFAGVGGTRRIKTTYHPGGKVATIDAGDGAATDAVWTRAKISYDQRNQPVGLTYGTKGAAATTTGATLVRNAAGLVKTRIRPAVTVLGVVKEPAQYGSWTYDQLGRVTRQKVTRDTAVGTSFADLQLTYRGTDDPWTLVHSGNGLTTRSFTFTYDARHQLTNVTTSPARFTSSYSFTPGGRLQSANVTPNISSLNSDVWARNVTYQYADADPEMVSSLREGANDVLVYTYDEAGNVTQRMLGGYTDFAWDGDDKLRRASVGTTAEEYFYDHDGTRVGIVKRNPGVTEVRYFQGPLELWMNSAGTLTRRLAHLSLGQPIARVETTGSGTNTPTVELQYHSTLQSLLTTVTTTGTVTSSFLYGPYGEVLQASGTALTTHRRRYNDKYKDELTGLGYYGYRYYDPYSQTWISADPLYRFAPDRALEDPRRANLYTFNLGSPLRFVDPDGREPWGGCGECMWDGQAEADGHESNSMAVRAQGEAMAGMGYLVIGTGLIAPEFVFFASMSQASNHNETVLPIVLYFAPSLLKIRRPAANSADDALAGLPGEARRSIASLEKRAAEHRAKLEAYRQNPDAFDNLGHLRNAPSEAIRTRIIEGRIKHLEQEIRNFEKQIERIIKNHTDDAGCYPTENDEWFARRYTKQ